MVADFMRYYTGTKISHFSRFHEISNSNLNISWLQFSWDITLCSQYLIVDDFMRYYNRTKISHVCRFHEIFHRNLNISWLHISRLRFRLAHHRTALRYFFSLFFPMRSMISMILSVFSWFPCRSVPPEFLRSFLRLLQLELVRDCLNSVDNTVSHNVNIVIFEILGHCYNCQMQDILVPMVLQWLPMVNNQCSGWMEW